MELAFAHIAVLLVLMGLIGLAAYGSRHSKK